jgi:hypothetical protein
MTFTASIIAVGLVGVLFLVATVRSFRRRRVAGGVLNGLISIASFLMVACILTVAANLRGYQRLTAEQPAGELQFARIGYHQFNGVFTFPSGESADFALRGDEWQVDARVLKWQVLANLMGFDSAYRLDRISGRYTNVEDERSQPRTVYALNQPDHVDLWELVHRCRSWLPGVDALYGSATFLPMADGARYEITISQSGLIARPLNDAARAAVGNWNRS